MKFLFWFIALVFIVHAMTVHASPIREGKVFELMKRCNDGGAGCGSGDGCSCDTDGVNN
ncbi:15819_t:CDS:2 [Rhizophagus irregularis]|nr:15819_t:CDS:2 [Rhizophagus irregularis]